MQIRPRRRELDLHRPAQLGGEPALDHPRAESRAAPARGTGGPSRSVQISASRGHIIRAGPRPFDPDAPLRLRERAVLDRVGGELVDRERERDRRLGSDRQIGSREIEPLAAARVGRDPRRR